MRDAIGPLGTGSTACTPGERARACAWFRDPSVDPMSFRWLCLVLDLDPDAVLRRLEQPIDASPTFVVPDDAVEPAALRAEG